MKSFYRCVKSAVSFLVKPFTSVPNRNASAFKLEMSVGQVFTFPLQERQIGDEKTGKTATRKRTVNVSSITLRNNGQERVTGVKLLYRSKPDAVYLRQMHAVFEEPEGRYAIVLDEMWPGNEISIGAMTVDADAPELIHVRSNECEAQEERRIEMIGEQE